MKVLVTGAGGFVGRPLCRRLAEEGHEVIAATRKPGEFGLNVRNEAIGDLRDVREWPSLRGCDAVVHLAAHVHRMTEAAEDERLFREVNVDATARLAAEAGRHGVRRFVFMSTVKVHGERSESRPLVEASPIAPRDAYARSKAEAEIILRESGIPSVILRPPLIYGPGVGSNFLRLLRGVSKRRPIPLGRARNLRSLVFVGNVVDAIVTCLKLEAARSHVFLLRDGEDISSAELIRRLAAALEVRPRLLSVPLGMLAIAGVLTGRQDVVRRLTEPFQVDDTAIREELGWLPPFTIDEGFEQTARWFRAGESR